MSCLSCDKVRANQYSGEYRVGCLQCSLRAFSRSMLAADAVRTRSTADLRAALQLAHPGTPIDAALRGVWAWWQSDRQHEGTKT